MKIAIVEDEPVIAQRLQRLIKELLQPQTPQINWFDDFDDAEAYLAETGIDLLVLDLNLHGANGFDLLATVNAASFFTIIVSAYADQAIKAFEYGVLDFVAKPFNRERLAQALARFHDQTRSGLTKQLAVKKPSGIELIAVEQLAFVRADGHYTQLVEFNKAQHLHDKAIDKLAVLLPAHFMRIHRSFIANLSYATKLIVGSGGQYQMQMSNGETLPVSRSRYKEVKQRLTI